MVFDKMAAIGPDFNRLGFLISDPIQNPDHLQPNFSLTIIWNLDKSEFHIPNVSEISS